MLSDRHILCELDLEWLIHVNGDKDIAKHLADLLQSLSPGFRQEEVYNRRSNQVAYDEDKVVAPADVLESRGRCLGKHNLDDEAAEGGYGTTGGTDLRGEDLGAIERSSGVPRK